MEFLKKSLTQECEPFIIATVGMPCCEPDGIDLLLRNGVNVLRYNIAADLGYLEHSRRIKLARGEIYKAGKAGNVAIMLDLPFPGRKIRIGMLPERKHTVKKGEIVTFKTGKESINFHDFIPVNYPNIARFVEPGKDISIGDGELALKVKQQLSDESFSAVALNDGFIPCQKSVNFGHIVEAEIDEEMLAFVAETRPDWIALSFINDVQQLTKSFEIMSRYGITRLNTSFVIKIETQQGVDNIHQFIKLVDAVIIARGDLAVSADYFRLGINQKLLTDACKRAKMPVILSTQILESSCEWHVPARAEISGLTYAILDGINGIMLAKETSSLNNISRPLIVMNEIINECKKFKLQ
ncbi:MULTISPECIES: pyruvate kinase [Photorhabdus]|uniref:Pyruvate kinase n=1 Tax=Photorhabdus bodei TaxID=2029681 RepID=A0AAW6BL17_9GAMM|nr:MULTISPECIES: pyruvate kinase [Photorhabdus]MCT8351796.1 hypothetical protein [Photorhabdus kayaii]MDB6373471.1 pyruvate kinase [Photorhabdus bodei]